MERAKIYLEQKAPGSTSDFNNTRKKAQDRFNQWKTRTNGGTTYNSSNRRTGGKGRRSGNSSSTGRTSGKGRTRGS